MIRAGHLRSRAAGIAGALAVAAGIAGLAATAVASPPPRRAPGSRVVPAPTARRTTIHVGGDAPVPATSTAQGFLGIATEINTFSMLAGPARDPDTPFARLLRDLSPGAPFLLRLGGNSGDDSAWPVPGRTFPRYLYRLTPGWAADARTLLDSIDGRAILGVPLEERSGAIVRTAVADYDRYLGTKLIDAFELGNEPEFFPWTQVGAAGRTHDPRAAFDTRFAYYGKVFSQIAGRLGGAPLAGPGTGSPHWVPALGTVLRDLRTHLTVATIHGYPLKNCSRLASVSVGDFFTHASIPGLAESVHAAVRAAAAHREPLRVDEINGITCGGKAGFSNSFGEALWALNILPALWRAGVQGVNFQTVDFPGNLNQVITPRHTAAGWRVSVEPEYYGLLAFADAAPAGSRLLRITPPGSTGLYQYAVRAPDGTERAVLTDIGSDPRTIDLTAADTHGVTGTVSLLSAASLNATGGVTLGGRRLSARTGGLSGTAHTTTVRPDRHDVYAVTVPAHAAAILTLPRASRTASSVLG